MRRSDEFPRFLRMAERLGGLGHWQIDLVNDTLFWSDEVYRIHGVTPETCTPAIASAIAFYHPDDRDRVQRDLDAAITAGRDFEFSLRLVRPDGTIRHVRSRGECSTDADGAVTTVSGVFLDITDSVHADQRLSLERSLRDAFVGASADGFVERDMRTGVLTLSDQCWRQLGYAPGEISQQALLERALPGDFDRAASRRVGCLSDMTALRRAEAARARTEALMETAIESSGLGLWTIDRRDGETWFSERFNRILRLDPNGPPPTIDLLLALTADSDRARARTQIEALLANGGSMDAEFRLSGAPDEAPRHVRVRARSEWAADGRPVRLSGSIEDITERRRDAQRLAESLRFQQLVMSTMDDLLFVKDAQCRIVQANKAFLDRYPEEARDRVIGSTTVEDYDPDQAEAFLADDRFALEHGFSEVQETIDFPSGSRQTLLTRKLRFQDHDGEPYILGIARDITSLIETERELREVNAELETLVYRISHDLRSPLVSTSKLLELQQQAIEQGDREDALRFNSLATHSMRKLLKLLEDLLEMRRLTADRGGPVAVELAPLVSALWHRFIDEAKMEAVANGDTRVPVLESSMAGCPVITVDAVCLQIILENLLSNAIKYRDPDQHQPRVRVSAGRAGDTLLLAVEDNGIGVPEKYRERLFGMFERFHANYASGSGLGLYMTRKAVLQLNGSIQVRHLDHGTRFEVTLPLHASPWAHAPTASLAGTVLT